MKYYLCSKVKYVLNEIKDDLKNIEEKKVVVLPWSYPDFITKENVEEEWINRGRLKYEDPLKQLGYSVIIENSFEKPMRDIISDINNSSVLLITGGNPNRLLETIKPYTSLLKEYKGIIIGESAGAEIFFDNYYIMEENSFIGRQEKLKGINLINNFFIDVHSIQNDDYINKLLNISKLEKRPMYFVDNESAIEYNTKTKEIKCLGNAKLIK